MIDRLAKELGMEQEALVDLILRVAGDGPQFTVTNQSFMLEGGAMREWRNTGRIVVIATGKADDFDLELGTVDAVHRTHRVKSIKVTLP